MKIAFVLAATAIMTASALADAVPDPNITYPAANGTPHTCVQDYPSLAVRRGEQGSVTVRIAILEDGSVRNPELEESSGSDLLDQASLDCVKAWTYLPAKRNGTPIAILWAVRVEWYLQFIYEGPADGDPRKPDPRFIAPDTPPGEKHACSSPPSYIATTAEKVRYRPSVVTYTITPKGTTDDIRIVRPSGITSYDDTAMKCIKSWRYTPATRDGAAVAVRWTASIPWGDSDSDAKIKPPERLTNPEPQPH